MSLLCSKHSHHYLLLLWIIIACCSATSSVKDIRNEMINTEFTLEVAKLNQLVYQIPNNESNETISDTLEQIIPTEKYDIIGWIDDDSTEVLVVTTKTTAEKKKIILVFRGTDGEAIDWITNLNFGFGHFGPPNQTLDNLEMYQATSSSDVEAVPILVHRGFNSGLRLYDRILKLIADAQAMIENGAKNMELYVGGHSLGGANAQAFSAFYAYQNPTVSVYCTTFGQPRLGNAGYKIFFESLWNCNIWRVVNQHDIVPRVPSFVQNFTHAGHLLLYYTDAERDNQTTIANAYYRQIGDTRRGYKGIPDFSIALLTAEELIEVVDEHRLGPYIDWISDPSNFPNDFVKK